MSLHNVSHYMHKSVALQAPHRSKGAASLLKLQSAWRASLILHNALWSKSYLTYSIRTMLPMDPL